MSSQSGLAAYEPVVGSLGLAGYGNVACRFGLKITAVVPVAGYILDELEGIVVLLVVLREVGSHLERTVHRHIKGKLSDKRGVYIALVVAPSRQLRLKNSRRVVHRTALQTGEREDDSVVGVAAAECFIFRTPCRLVADEVRPCTAETGRTCRFVCVHHDMMPGSLLDDTEIVVVHRL